MKDAKITVYDGFIKGYKKDKIEPAKHNTPNNVDKYQYVVLGNNRNGYDTFQKIIQQVNGENPVFAIDNGDLIFSGKPNCI